MQPQYRHAQQAPPHRSPLATSQRRGGIGPMMSAGPHPSVPLTQSQIATQQQNQAQANELARRRSRKPTDKNLPEGIEDIIVDPEAVQRYKDLRDVERRLDATMTRKRLDVVDSAGRNGKVPRTMRVWISNTVEDQIWQGNGFNVDSFDFTPSMEASYRVKISGRLLEDDESSDLDSLQKKERSESADAQQNASSKKSQESMAPTRFSHFFKSISVELGPSRFRNGSEQSIEWNKPESAMRPMPEKDLSPAANFDEITFKRNGDENQNVTFQLYRHELPARYQLSPELAEVVDMAQATQQEAVMGLWEYIRLSNLQEDEERRNFRCDEALRNVIGRDVGYIPLLNEYVTHHLRPLPPVNLPYTIRVDEQFHRNPEPTIYDIQVWVDDPLRARLMDVVNNQDYGNLLREVMGLDDQLARLVQSIAVSKAKHSFLTSLSEDPANFIRNWLSSQKRDLDIIMGEATRTGGDNLSATEEWRRGGRNSVWTTQNARESVNVLLSKQR